jgi:hypothetical protein
MKHYNLKTLQRTKTGYTDLFILSSADTDFIKNATTDVVLTALAAGDIVDKISTEVRTAVAGPTATLSVGVTSAVTQFTPAGDIATGTAVPYVAGNPAVAVGTGFIAATSAGAVTTALTNATSGVSSIATVQPRYATLSSKNLIAETILSNVTVTAGEVWIWASIDRLTDRNSIQVN